MSAILMEQYAPFGSFCIFCESDPCECDRKIVTTFDPPPIPSRKYDWRATLEDYDFDGPIGFGGTEQEAIADLEEQLE
jgi:hypothetical protein